MLNIFNYFQKLHLNYSSLKTVCKVHIMENVSPYFEKPNVRNLRSRTLIKSEANVETKPKISVKGRKDIEQKTKKVAASKKLTSIKKEISIKSEPHLSATVKAEVCSDDDGIEMASNKPNTSKTQQKNSASPRKRKIKTEVSAKMEKVVKKEQASLDIEDAVWQPENWKTVLDNILEMRKLHVAPVDSLGCEECPEKGTKPEIFRYQTLISVMLSSQTRDEVTYAATQRLIEHGLSIDSILKTSDEKLAELIYPAGFYKSKVKFIKKTSQMLKDQFNGDIPRTFKELCKLPGVGPKMANIVMSVAWNDTVGIAVDTHVHRISNRLGWVPKPTKDPEQTRKALESWLPKELWQSASLDLVGFGQTICKPIKPKCQECLNINLCPFSKSTKK